MELAPSQTSHSDTPVKNKSLAFLPQVKRTSLPGRPRLSALSEGTEIGNIPPTTGMSPQGTTVGPSSEKQDSIWVCSLSLQLCYTRAPGLPRTQELKKTHWAELYAIAHTGPQVTHRNVDFTCSTQAHSSTAAPWR